MKPSHSAVALALAARAEPSRLPAFRIRELVRVLVRCGCCGRPHAADEWRSLELRGWQSTGEGDPLELRQCRCGSTLSVALSRLRHPAYAK